MSLPAAAARLPPPPAVLPPGASRLFSHYYLPVDVFAAWHGNIIMFSFLRRSKIIATSAIGRRSFSSSSSSSVEVAKSSGGGGAGFFSRVSSFLVGAGLTALVTEFYIFKEVREGNVELLRRHKEIEGRIAALEKKK